MKEAYGLLKLMNGVFDDHLDEYSEPERVKLRHIVKEGCDEAHELADAGLTRSMGRRRVYLKIGQAKVADVELLD